MEQFRDSEHCAVTVMDIIDLEMAAYLCERCHFIMILNTLDYSL